LIDAVRALDEELDPSIMREIADVVRGVAPNLAGALNQRAQQAVRIRIMIARALAGDLFPDDE
jgi:hypothetical protein